MTGSAGYIEAWIVASVLSVCLAVDIAFVLAPTPASPGAGTRLYPEQQVDSHEHPSL
jgi:hypothetical protein